MSDRSPGLYIVFNGPPGPASGRYRVELERRVSAKDACPQCGRPKSVTSEVCIICYRSNHRKKGT